MYSLLIKFYDIKLKIMKNNYLLTFFSNKINYQKHNSMLDIKTI